jgi:Ca2+-binding RTX toxin-like protein
MAEIRDTAQANLLAGTSEDDLIFGLTGNDTIAGNSGNDSIYGGKQSDLIDGNLGQDSLFGDLDNDTVNGGEGNDFLVGGKGSDSISGNSGNDVLSGDRDTDILIGGDGADIFVLRRYAEADPNRTSGGVSLANADAIADFAPGTDLIGLAGGLSFSDLNILEAGNDTVIQDRVTGEFLATLRGVRQSAINQASFTNNIGSVVPNPPPPPLTTAYGLTPTNRIVGFSLSNPGKCHHRFARDWIAAGRKFAGN